MIGPAPRLIAIAEPHGPQRPSRSPLLANHLADILCMNVKPKGDTGLTFDLPYPNIPGWSAIN